MTNSLYADGVALDAFAQTIGNKSNRWSIPGARGENVPVPARHGSLYVADKTFEENEITLEILVNGVYDDGRVPIDQIAKVRENIDRLLRIFTKRKKLIRLTQVMDNGIEVEAFAECTGAFDLVRDSAAMPYARFAVALRIPAAFWQEVTPQEYASPTGLKTNQVLRIPPFEGGTAPMDDAAYLFHGPVDTPELYVTATGAFTRLNRFVPAGHTWRLDASNWTSVVGPAVTFYSSGDPSCIGDTVHGGSASLMDLPPLGLNEYAIEVGGTQMGSATQLEIRGRRKYLIS